MSAVPIMSEKARLPIPIISIKPHTGGPADFCKAIKILTRPKVQEERKLPLFVENIIFNTEKAKETTIKILKINELARPKDTIKNQLYFHALTEKKIENEISEIIPFMTSKTNDLEVSLTKDIEDIHTENYNTLRKIIISPFSLR